MSADLNKLTAFVLHGGTLLVAQLVEALRYKPEGRGVRFPIVS